ncbi:hypothetical protein [Yinghuangia sp. YIM S09857]|uniref:hypothetical protein n=1 Tax=Yinghuangia sp. YIM S09857 TaxID=3436929 RepID=UPI003F5302F0
MTERHTEDTRVAGHHRLSVRAHLLERTGDAAEAYDISAARPGPPRSWPSSAVWPRGQGG